MRLLPGRRAPRAPRGPVVVGVDLGTLRLDHQVTHTYMAKPEPKYVRLQLTDQHSGRVGQYLAQYPGAVIRIPRYMLGDQPTEQGEYRPDIELQVSW